MPSASEMKCMMYVGRWVWEGDTLPRIAFNLLKDTAIYDSHLSNMKLCVCVCVRVHFQAQLCFRWWVFGVQVAVYCNTVPTVCNSMGDVGAQHSISHKNTGTDALLLTVT